MKIMAEGAAGIESLIDSPLASDSKRFKPGRRVHHRFLSSKRHRITLFFTEFSRCRSTFAWTHTYLRCLGAIGVIAAG
jgi:hypothetical protein